MNSQERSGNAEDFDTDETSSETTTSSDDEIDNSSNAQSVIHVRPIPAIRKDGMAICECCGAVGVKHAFYSKSKRYCSVACCNLSRKVCRRKNAVEKCQQVKRIKLPKKGEKTRKCGGGLLFTANGTSTSKTAKQEVYAVSCSSVPTQNAVKETIGKNVTLLKNARPPTAPNVRYDDPNESFDWSKYFSKPGFAAAQVSSFKHVPFANAWKDSVTPGTQVEVINRDFNCFSACKVYWFATILEVAGYFVRLRYEGSDDKKDDFWIHLGVDEIHPVTWCAREGKPLLPPKCISSKHKDWREYLKRSLINCRTVLDTFLEKMKTDSSSSSFKPGMKLEVVDKRRISVVRSATVDQVCGGRLHVVYDGDDTGESGFWCHEQSSLIYSTGWAEQTGHAFHTGTQSTKTASTTSKKGKQQKVKTTNPHELSSEVNHHYKHSTCDLEFKENMKLEAIDPLNLSTICVATVKKVLKGNYIMVGIDGATDDNGSDWFCHDTSSPCIFPVGFCELNVIKLTPPANYPKPFNWFEYLQQTRSIPAPVGLFQKDVPNHGFKEGRYLEAVDLMEPKFICVAKITRVVGRLLKIHFEGWDETYDQWCDCRSPDLYPIGWCRMVGYRLEPPRYHQNVNPPVKPHNKVQSRNS